MSKSTQRPSRPARPKATSSSTTKTATKKPSTTRPTTRNRAPSTADTRFRSRHPVLAALVPVGLVVAAVATMVVIKATGGSAPSAAASSHLATSRVVGHRRPGNHGALAERARGAVGAGGDAGRSGQSRRGRPAHRGRERRHRAGSRRQAADHLCRRRVLPLLRRRALGPGRRAVTVRDLLQPVGYALVGRRRLPGYADALVLRVELHQPLRRLPARRGGNEPAGRRELPGTPGADGGAECADGQVRPAGEHPVPRHREPLRDRRGELLAPGAPGPVPEPDRGPAVGCPPARSRRRSTGRRTTSRPPSARSRGTSRAAVGGSAAIAAIAQKLGA